MFKKNFSKFLKTLIPFVPHIAHECLEQIKEKIQMNGQK
jgi:leucyl-tRNA synthetase